MHHLRFRQVHLDFHTSPDIPGIGEAFDREKWQRQLRDAHVDSITCFAICHHGWSYHPTKVGEMHPHLKFDLLRAQFDACKQIDVNVPVYITAGFNQRVAMLHPEWHEISPEGRGPDPLHAGFIKLCFNTAYLDLLCAEIEETAALFPNCDGIFLDIINQGQCCCPACLEGMKERGLDARAEADRKLFAEEVLQRYYERTTAAARKLRPDMPVFHNSGHVTVGKTGILKYFSHLELESLPTGGWGYDHYPLSAAYSRKLGLDFLGMTGKFHTTWGEFGGIKHPNALRYECAAMIANGSKCSVGDQLHPDGALDESTYSSIAAAYREVEEKEAWCDNVTSRANLAVLSVAGFTHEKEEPADVGAARLLLEAHIPFDMIDADMEFNGYRYLLLPDEIRIDEKLERKLRAFRDQGGKLILSGASGLKQGEDVFALELPIEGGAENGLNPDYVKGAPGIAPDFAKTPFVMYLSSRRVKAKAGVSLGGVFDPYFNRDYRHFCSHQHTPNRPEPSGYDAGVMTDDVLYFAHPVFSIYRSYGAVAVQAFVLNALRRFMGDEVPVKLEGMPTTGRVTLMRQQSENRDVLHLLYANTVNRGGGGVPVPGETWPGRSIEVIEELTPIGPIRASVWAEAPVKSVKLVPAGTELPFEQKDGRVVFTVPEFTCHQMVELAY